jgi:2-polyprenyl-3-methyl-5-hydroxy-6-metoxy-1,4-benzoquinol methylase
MSHYAQDCMQLDTVSTRLLIRCEIVFTIVDNEYCIRKIIIFVFVGIVDGMSIIDLGCGWGSVSIYLASKFPNCKITSVSNSHSQKVFIMGRAAERGYKNINVYTGDIISDLSIYILICHLKHIVNYHDRVVILFN